MHVQHSVGAHKDVSRVRQTTVLKTSHYARSTQCIELYRPTSTRGTTAVWYLFVSTYPQATTQAVPTQKRTTTESHHSTHVTAVPLHRHKRTQIIRERCFPPHPTGSQMYQGDRCDPWDAHRRASLHVAAATTASTEHDLEAKSTGQMPVPARVEALCAPG